MATVTLKITPGTNGGSSQTTVGVRNAPRDYRAQVDAYLADQKIEAMTANGEFEISRQRVNGVVATLYSGKDGKISVSLQGETVNLPGFPMPENAFAQDEAVLAAVKLAFAVPEPA